MNGFFPIGNSEKMNYLGNKNKIKPGKIEYADRGGSRKAIKDFWNYSISDEYK